MQPPTDGLAACTCTHKTATIHAHRLKKLKFKDNIISKVVNNDYIILK